MNTICPECENASFVDAGAGDIVQCPACGAEMEVINADPGELALAPEVEEDCHLAGHR